LFLKVLEQVGFKVNDGGEWRFLKLVEEAEFGPGLPVHRVYIVGKLLPGNQNLPGLILSMLIMYHTHARAQFSYLC
jgi:hypothetical protein